METALGKLVSPNQLSNGDQQTQEELNYMIVRHSCIIAALQTSKSVDVVIENAEKIYKFITNNQINKQ